MHKISMELCKEIMTKHTITVSNVLLQFTFVFLVFRVVCQILIRSYRSLRYEVVINLSFCASKQSSVTLKLLDVVNSSIFFFIRHTFYKRSGEKSPSPS